MEKQIWLTVINLPTILTNFQSKQTTEGVNIQNDKILP